MRVLLMGNNKLATYVMDMLVEDQHQVLYLNTCPELADAISEVAGEAMVVVSEGPLMEDLRQAGVDKVGLFLAFSDDDSTNAMAAQIASHIFHVPKVLCLINDLRRSQVYRELGLEVVSPNQLILDAARAALQE